MKENIFTLIALN